MRNVSASCPCQNFVWVDSNSGHSSRCVWHLSVALWLSCFVPLPSLFFLWCNACSNLFWLCFLIVEKKQENKTKKTLPTMCQIPYEQRRGEWCFCLHWVVLPYHMTTSSHNGERSILYQTWSQWGRSEFPFLELLWHLCGLVSSSDTARFQRLSLWNDDFHPVLLCLSPPPLLYLLWSGS